MKDLEAKRRIKVSVVGRSFAMLSRISHGNSVTQSLHCEDGIEPGG
jgi:hypothetical protein